MTHSSSSTVPGASDAPSQDGNGPLSLDALFSAEISGGEQTGPAKNDEESGVAAPHHRDGTASSPEDFATPASSDSPEDPEDVDHEEEADDVDRDLPEADPEDGIDDSDEDDGVDIDEDEVDGHTPFIDTDTDSDTDSNTGSDTVSDGHQRSVERTASPRNRDKSEVRTAQEDEEITFADLGLPGDLLKAVTDMGFVTPTAIQKEAIPVLLAGRDVVGVAQTGTGKTAAFGLPLLDAVEEQVVLLRLFTADNGAATGENRMRVSIGSENNDDALAEASVVTTTYGPGTGEAVAHLGVIGPTRMDYPATMTAVRAVARYLSRFLSPPET